MRLTVGPLPAAVYWRRRALVLGAALLVVFLIAQACMAAGSGPSDEVSGGESPGPGEHTIGGALGFTPPADREPEPDDSQRADEVAAPDPEAPQLDAAQCTDEEMSISAEVRTPGGGARTEFSAGEPVEFWIIIRNDADRTCVRNIGGSYRELYLIEGTGASRFWSSRGCAAPEGDDEQELSPGFEASYYLVWNGRASSSCDDDDQPDGPLVTPGEYQLYASLGSALSDPVDLTVG